MSRNCSVCGEYHNTAACPRPVVGSIQQLTVLTPSEQKALYKALEQSCTVIESEEVKQLRARVAELEAALGDCAADNHELLGDNERLREALEKIVDRELSCWDTRDGNPPPDVQYIIDEARAALEQSND